MAKIIQDYEFGKIMNMVRRGSNLSSEAERLGISREELVSQGDQKYDRNSKDWEACKRLSEKREKRLTPKKRKPVPEPTPAPAPDQTPAAPVAPMEELLRKREGLKKELVTCASFLEEAEAILTIRRETLAEAKSVLEKAQAAVYQAETEEAEAQTAVKRAQAQQAEAQQELQGIEQAIKELREKTIYLVDPWFTGNLPEYGAFISTVEMEGVKTQEVPEEYLPDASLDGVLLFDFVPDYKKARIFCGLVAKYELEETPYSLLVSDERVKELLKMYIGK